MKYKMIKKDSVIITRLHRNNMEIFLNKEDIFRKITQLVETLKDE